MKADLFLILSLPIFVQAGGDHFTRIFRQRSANSKLAVCIQNSWKPIEHVRYYTFMHLTLCHSFSWKLRPRISSSLTRRCFLPCCSTTCKVLHSCMIKLAGEYFFLVPSARRVGILMSITWSLSRAFEIQWPAVASLRLCVVWTFNMAEVRRFPRVATFC